MAAMVLESRSGYHPLHELVRSEVMLGMVHKCTLP